MRDRRRCNSPRIPPQLPATRAISQWARSLEWSHAVTLHILVGKICISFLIFYCKGMVSLVVLWLCGQITGLWHSEWTYALTCTRETCCCSQTAGTNGDDLYIHIATVGNTIQTANSPMYDTYMSTPANTAKPRATHSNIQIAQSSPSLVGSEPTML